MALTFDAPAVVEGEPIEVTWSAPGAERCAFLISPDEEAGLPSLPASSDRVPPTGSRRVVLERTSVITLRCESGANVAYRDVRLHVRAPPPPLSGPRRSSVVPVGLSVFAGRGGRLPEASAGLLSGELDTVLAGLTPSLGAAVLVDPDLGSGALLGPLSWVIGTPYTAQALLTPDQALLVYAGVGARVGLRLRALELSMSATTGPALGAAWQPAPTGIGALVTDGRLQARWRPRDTLVLGLFVGGYGALSLDLAQAGFVPRVRWAPTAGVELLVGLGG